MEAGRKFRAKQAEGDVQGKRWRALDVVVTQSGKVDTAPQKEDAECLEN